MRVGAGPGGAGGDTGAGGGGACGKTLTLTGAPDFMGTTFTQDDPLNPNPVVAKSPLGSTSITFAMRDADPTKNKGLSVGYMTDDPTKLAAVTMTTGTPGYMTFDLKGCPGSCVASAQGVTVDTVGRCVKFSSTVVYRNNLANGTQDTPVTIDGSIGY